MPETIDKLRPDRDLQCYFYDQSAIAALSEASEAGFTLSGTWRQQFDWAVVEWSRDNVFEHPALRTLPDGNLNGLTLTYDEERENCIPMDSKLGETVPWPYIRVWAGADPVTDVYFVPVDPSRSYVEAVEGSYETAYADFTLSGSAVAGQQVGLSYTGEFFTGQNFVYTLTTTSLADAAQGVVDGINGASSCPLKAERIGTTVRVYYTEGSDPGTATTGVNGNRFAMFAYTYGDAAWDAPGKTFAHGVSPTKWRVTLDFSSLYGSLRNTDGSFEAAVRIPPENIRKVRWTFAADQQAGEFARSEFAVTVSNWTVTDSGAGTGRAYQVAGPGSRRIEDDDPSIAYSGTWIADRGNYSGGTIHRTSNAGATATLTYYATGDHVLYVGTRFTDHATTASFTMDGAATGSVDLHISGEDVLIRWRVGSYGVGAHTLVITHAGSEDEDLFFDFIELAAPAADLPEFPEIAAMTLATDWDTLHSSAIAPERSAWMIQKMGFRGRQNHYVGALLFYETVNVGNAFASRTITFSGTAEAGKTVWLEVGPTGGVVHLERIVQYGETIETVALSFAQHFNRGYTTVRAAASGGAVTIYSRELGTAGEATNIGAYSESSLMTVSPTSGNLEDGADGVWRTDLAATPRLNRAMRDWTRSFLAALHGYGIDAVCAFSTEMKHADPSVEAGIAQRDHAGTAIALPTPAVQTNFSPASLAFWKQVHADCAQVMDEAGITPYLQFGEEQWWYFPHNGLPEDDVHRVDFASMPYYDAWAQSEFETRYGHAMAVIADNTADPAAYPDEAAFLAAVLGEFTDAVMAYVRGSYSAAKFEVLWPFDVNVTEWARAVNLAGAWTPTALDCFKTEGLSLTFTKNLKASEAGIGMGETLGFAAAKRAHLVGLGDATAAWLKEARVAEGQRFESVVLFALDQFCLIGYGLPLPVSARRAVRVRK